MTDASKAAMGANTSYGGTSWGVSTGNSMSKGSLNVAATPSKNTKLDSKHVVKCISNMEQLGGLSKNEIRIQYKLNGGNLPSLQTGMQPTSSNPMTGGFNFGNNSALNTKTAFGATGAGTSGTSFSSFSNNNNNSFLGTPKNNVNQGATIGSPFQPAATTNQGSFFGGTGTPIGGSTFGATSNGTSIFGGGQTTTNTGGVFGGQKSAFGTTTPPQQQGVSPSLFGGQTPTFTGAPNTNSFSTPGTGNTSLFGGGSVAQPAQSTFGSFAQPAATTGQSLFGAQGAPQPQTAPNPMGQIGAGLLSSMTQQPTLQQPMNLTGSLPGPIPFNMLSSIVSNGDENKQKETQKMMAGLLQAMHKNGYLTEEQTNEIMNPADGPFDRMVQRQQK